MIQPFRRIIVCLLEKGSLCAATRADYNMSLNENVGDELSATREHTSSSWQVHLDAPAVRTARPDTAWGSPCRPDGSVGGQTAPAAGDVRRL